MSAIGATAMRSRVLAVVAAPTRRQLAVGGVAVTLLALTGCTDDTDDSSDRSAALPRLRRNPDHDLVVASLAVEQEHLDRLTAVRRRHRPVRAALAASVAVHLSHVELLRRAVEDADAPEPAPWPVPGAAARALAALAASARSASAEQADIAMAAESGTFARLAAGMAAAAAQQERFLVELRPRRQRADR
jgi:hypothetical protein